MFGLFKKTDPVCKMKIGKTEHFSEYKGKTYHFCSQRCKRQFDFNPKNIIKKDGSAQAHTSCH